MFIAVFYCFKRLLVEYENAILSGNNRPIRIRGSLLTSQALVPAELTYLLQLFEQI